MLSKLTAALAALLLGVTAQNNSQLVSDPGTYGPTPELVHLYYDQWPTGIAVAADGRKFSNYPLGQDPTNTRYSVAELLPNNTETPYPSAEINSPPGGSINYTTYPPSGANYQDYLVGVQTVVIDPANRLWILDTGRAATANGTMVPASYGGPKLIGVDLSNNSIFTTIVFSPTAAPADSYLNDVRFDLNSSLTDSGEGIAYITDSSMEGRNAIVIVDLGAKTAWRHLQNIPAVSATQGFVPTVWGQPVYGNGTTGMPIGNLNFGVDGLALSADAQTAFFSTTGGREMYSVPTAYLRDNGPSSEQRANAAVTCLGPLGLSDAMETDTNNNIYRGDIENNAIVIYSPQTATITPFVRDPRFSWTDTFSTGVDGYLYFTENQLWRLPSYQGGVDKRVKPYALFRVQLPNNGTKVTQSAP